MNKAQLKQVEDIKEQIAQIIRKARSFKATSSNSGVFEHTSEFIAESILKIGGLAILDKDQTFPKSSPTINQDYHDGYDEATDNLNHGRFKRVIITDNEAK
jgi:hypothetical protein